MKIARPVSLRAVSPEGTETPVALTGQRGRYERAARTLISLGADLAHCLDADGNVTESIAVSQGEPDGEAQKRADVRTRDQELAALLRIVVDAQDKSAGRYNEVLVAHQKIAEQLTNAAVGVMRAASERAAKLESIVMRLTVAREQELQGRERDLRRMLREMNDTDGEPPSSESSVFDDPNVARIIDIAEAAVNASKPSKKAEG